MRNNSMRNHGQYLTYTLVVAFDWGKVDKLF